MIPLTISGTHCQSDSTKYGDAAGKQCTAMSIAAIAFSSKKNILNWETTDVDEILFLGNHLYLHSCKTHHGGRLIFLEPTEVPEIFTNNFHIYKINVPFLNISGVHDIFHEYIDLTSKLEQYFTTHNHCVVVSCLLSVALFKIDSDTGIVYALFDSHSRDISGRIDPNGVARVTFYASLRNLIENMTYNYGRPNFNIQSVFETSGRFTINNINILLSNSTTTFGGTCVLDEHFKSAESQAHTQQGKL